MAFTRADEHDDIAALLEADADRAFPVGQQADTTDRGRRQDGASAAVLILGLVVERHIAAYDGEIERQTGLRHSLDTAYELPHNFGTLRVAEIHAVGGGKRGRANRGQIAPAFSDGLL